jgi:D-tyrosyl-tRNA(Tyr) deacylase
VTVGGEVRGAIGPGLLVLLGVTHDDGDREAEWLAKKISGLRVFEDEAGAMNRDAVETGGAFLVVPQFTLYGDARRGRRPEFLRAARPEHAEPLFERFCASLAQSGRPVERGVFRATMRVELVNEGPVTLMLESEPASPGTA